MAAGFVLLARLASAQEAKTSDSVNHPAQQASAKAADNHTAQEIFRPPMADQTEPFDRARYGGGQLDFGLALPLSVYTSEGSTSSWQIGFLGGIAAGFGTAQDTLRLEAADFHAGIPLAYRRGKWSTRVEFYHVSSHLGADTAVSARPFTYSREVLQELVSYDFSKDFRIYAGPSVLVRTRPQLGRWTFQAGSEWFPRQLSAPLARFYLADDFQTRQEVAWRTNVSIEPGLEFTTRKQQPVARLEAWFYSGQQPFGQLYYRRERVLGAQLIVVLGMEIKSLVTRRH